MLQSYSPKLLIQGGFSLSGSVEVQGSKNAVLVSICALLLTKGISVLRNVPCITDVFEMIKLIEYLGAQVTFDTTTHVLIVDSSELKGAVLNQEITSTTRASILLAAPLLALENQCSIAFPGGDVLGSRPIDYHLYALQRLGCSVEYRHDIFEVRRNTLQANRIVFEYPSVGATENALMLAVLCPGTTTIVNAALEPEVMELIMLLRSMGAIISCEVYATLLIQGVTALHPTDYMIMPDRLEVGTLLIAAAISKGFISIPNAQPWYLELFLNCLTTMGNRVEYDLATHGISLTAGRSLKNAIIKTGPYPGFPTDLQALMVALLTQAHGKSLVYETVYEQRFQYAQQLAAMGAKVSIHGSCLSIEGPCSLQGMLVEGSDIRATACLLIASLVAQGQTIIGGVEHLKRGYECLDAKLMALGASIAWQD